MIAVYSAPVVTVGHASIVTDEVNISAGANLGSYKTVACTASATAGVSQTPQMYITFEFRPGSGELRSQYQRRSNLSAYAYYFAH